MSNSIIISAPASGSGKTLITLSIMRAFYKKGYNVRPFKIGPDYLDTMYHKIAANNSVYNIDSWIMKKSFITSQLVRDSDNDNYINVIEGAMGLFDGFEGSLKGSTAEIAIQYNIPVVLVVNCKGLSGSIAPLVFGFKNYSKKINFAGVILNNVASEKHLKYLSESLKKRKIKILGHVFRNEEIKLHARHLGLKSFHNNKGNIQFIEKISEIVCQNILLDKIYKLSRIKSAGSRANVNNSKNKKNINTKRKCRIAIAYDKAFHFYYQANLDLLVQNNTELIYFSPIEDAAVPKGIHGIYIGGGYPELFAEELSKNVTMINDIRKFINNNGVVYAECGGLIYLGNKIIVKEESHLLCNIFNLDFKMLDRRKMLGYSKIEFSEDTILGKEGTSAKGHEFHYSEISNNNSHIKLAYNIQRKKEDEIRKEGYTHKNVLASYVHLHFGSNPIIAKNFVETCMNN